MTKAFPIPVHWLLLVLCACTTQDSRLSASDNQIYTVERLTGGLSHPWAIAPLPGGGVLITERPGSIRHFAKGTLSKPLRGAPRVAAGGQGGMLDIVLHPDFTANQLIYLTYSKPHNGAKTTAVLQARLDLANHRLTAAKDIFIASPALRSSHHYGSRMIFGKDGMLYFGIGDRGQPDQAQRLDNHLGKVIRLTPDGRVPPDNPFIGRAGALPEIYSLGHRNPQGIARTGDGAIWMHEHGPKGGDEINLLQPGKNYGWPVITYGVSYSGFPIGDGLTHKAGMEQPLWHWTPSIAPSGMVIYKGNKFARLTGNTLVGSLKFRSLERIAWSDGQVVTREALITGTIGRVRDIRETSDGELLLINDESDGGLFRLHLRHAAQGGTQSQNPL